MLLNTKALTPCCEGGALSLKHVAYILPDSGADRGYTGTGSIAAYSISSLLFALIHLNPSALAIYVVQGVVLARAYQVRGSVLTATVAHAMNNAVVITLMTLAP